MAIQSFEIDYEGKKEIVEYEDDLAFGELEAILNQCLDLSDVTKPKVNLPQYRQSILLKAVQKAPFNIDLPTIRNLKTSVVNQVLKGVLKDFPLVKFLEDWVGTFIGTQEDINIEQVSTTSSRKNSAGNKKK